MRNKKNEKYSNLCKKLSLEDNSGMYRFIFLKNIYGRSSQEGRIKKEENLRKENLTSSGLLRNGHILPVGGVAFCGGITVHILSNAIAPHGSLSSWREKEKRNTGMLDRVHHTVEEIIV